MKTDCTPLENTPWVTSVLQGVRTRFPDHSDNELEANNRKLEQYGSTKKNAAGYRFVIQKVVSEIK